MIRRSCSGPSRRDLLQIGVLSTLGLTLADYLRLRAANDTQPAADAVIFIHLQGGPAHLDTLDLKPGAPVAERGEFKPIASKLPGLPVCEHLPKLAQAIDQFTLLRGISHSAGDHGRANQYLFTGNPVSPAVAYPALGSVAIKERPARPDLPGFVAIPTSEMAPGYLGVSYAPFKTNAVPLAGKPFEVRGLALPEGVSVDKIKDRERLLQDLDTKLRQADTGSPLVEGLDRFGRQAQEMILSPRAREAFDISKESPPLTRMFAADEFSQSLLLAGRLVEQGVRFVTINSGGWDTHLDNFTSLKTRLLPPFDAGITALVQALAAKGLLDRTLVVAGGEFGRTPTINKNAGRDHWPRASWMLLAGGGVKAGQLIGGTDQKGHEPDSDTNLKPDDLAASVCHALGIDHHKEYQTRTGRPVYLVPHGKVIRELFGQS
jgi:uncharacterized protein (DUF1501 family)